MELTNEIISNLEQLGYELDTVTSGELHDMAPRIGYESLGYGKTFDDGTKSLLVQAPAGQNTYNNGVYLLRKEPEGQIVLEIIVPNTTNKGALIQRLVDDVTNHIDGLNTEDLTVFDYTEAFGFILANTVAKPLAKSLFPQDKSKQERFVLLYLPRLLANIAYQYSGTPNTYEEGVNSEPYVLKMMIDQGTDTDGHLQSEDDANNFAKQIAEERQLKATDVDETGIEGDVNETV